MRQTLINKIADYEGMLMVLSVKSNSNFLIQELKKNHKSLPNNFAYNHLDKYPIENMQELVEEYVMMLQTVSGFFSFSKFFELIC